MDRDKRESTWTQGTVLIKPWNRDRIKEEGGGGEN